MSQETKDVVLIFSILIILCLLYLLIDKLIERRKVKKELGRFPEGFKWLSNSHLTNLLRDIENPSNQILLIRMIEKGEVTFEKKQPSHIQYLANMFCDEYWQSNCGRIKLWFEYSAFGCFTYLKVFSEDYADKLEYGTELCLTIQKPEGGYLDKRGEKDDSSISST